MKRNPIHPSSRLNVLLTWTILCTSISKILAHAILWDAFYAGNEYISSQIGFITMLSNETTRAHILDYQSQKSHRVVRSVVAPKFAHLLRDFDTSLSLEHNLECTQGSIIRLTIFLDSLRLFDALVCAKLIDKLSWWMTFSLQEFYINALKSVALATFESAKISQTNSPNSNVMKLRTKYF